MCAGTSSLFSNIILTIPSPHVYILNPVVSGIPDSNNTYHTNEKNIEYFWSLLPLVDLVELKRKHKEKDGETDTGTKTIQL